MQKKIKGEFHLKTKMRWLVDKIQNVLCSCTNHLLFVLMGNFSSNILAFINQGERIYIGYVFFLFKSEFMLKTAAKYKPNY